MRENNLFSTEKSTLEIVLVGILTKLYVGESCQLLQMFTLIRDDSKEWDVEMLENFVVPENIPLIRSLAISQITHWKMYCWSYMNNDQYIVKSGYVVTRNILKHETEIV